MTITSYFIKHPVISLILNGMIILLGYLCFDILSVREYPQVDFPMITVMANYPNASAEVVETSVTNILEDKLSGVAGLETITSKSKQGSSVLTLFFKIGSDLDQAMIAIRDAISLARGNLPKEVREPVVKRGLEFGGFPFMMISLESPTLDFGALTHYARLNLVNGFRSLQGVSDVEVWGQPYTYEITLDPKKMLSFGVNADEIYNALERSNISLPVGKFRNEVPATLNAELKTLADYENLLIREKNFEDPNRKQHPIFLKSVAKIELKTDTKQFRIRTNGNPGLCLSINRANDANPLEVSNLVKNQLQEIQQFLPEGLKVELVVDQAEFIRSSLKGIQSSIIEAILFVLAIVFLFLRSFRATLIPLVTIPISLIGSLLFLKIFGFSINIITLLAMVLGVGLVVDDAIVVLENISRHIEEGLKPFEAAIKGAKEIGFAIVAMTLTLTSVYMPIAFIQGSVGQLFMEFAAALAGSVLISGVVALTLSPIMCATILKHKENRLFPQVDRFLLTLTSLYRKALNRVILKRKTALTMAFLALGGMILFFRLLPQELAPKEDRGVVGIWLPPIPGKDITYLEKKTSEVENKIRSIPEATKSFSFVGFWGGSTMLTLKDLSERSRSAEEIRVGTLFPIASMLPSANAWPWSWNSGLPGNEDALGGADLTLEISTTDSYRQLFDAAEKARLAVEEKSLFQSVRQSLKLDTPGYQITLDTNALSELNLSQSQVAKMIEVFFSGDQSLNFQKDGIQYPITLKGESEPWTLNELYVSNMQGKHISLAAVAKMVPSAQPEELPHYNQMRSVTLTAEMGPDANMSDLMAKMRKIVAENVPGSYKLSWTGIAKAYKESSNTMLMLFALALIFIYAILSLQFENFIDPFIVLLTVPLACFGAMFVAWLCSQTLNIYTQVGLITLIGLITKHGILIVEFTNQLHAEGEKLLDAIKKACDLRFRPILMTTSAMIVGMIPLIISHDAGYESRRAIGIILIGGLGFGTLFTLFVVPTLTYFIKSLQEGAKNSLKGNAKQQQI